MKEGFGSIAGFMPLDDYFNYRTQAQQRFLRGRFVEFL